MFVFCLRNQRMKLYFAFLFRGSVDVFMDALAVRAAGSVFAFPEVVVDLVQAAGAGFAAGALVWLEGLPDGSIPLLGRKTRQIGFWNLTAPYPGVDLLRRLDTHLVRHMAVDVQRRGGIHIADDGGEGFHIHAVLQSRRCEGGAQIMKAKVLTFRVLQDALELLPDGVRRARHLRIDR